MKFKSNINGIVKEIADHGNIDIDVTQETLDMQPEELSQGKCITINEGNSCEERIKMPQRRWHGENFTLKTLSEISHVTENTKDEMLLDNLNEERNTMICQGIDDYSMS